MQYVITAAVLVGIYLGFNHWSPSTLHQVSLPWQILIAGVIALFVMKKVK
jgi:hypothetical protein